MKYSFNSTIRVFFIQFVLMSMAFGLNAQQLDHVLGEIILEFEEGYDQNYLEENVRVFQNKRSGISSRKMRTDFRQIHHAYFDYTEINEYDFLEEIRKLEGVKLAQFNHLISYRNIPDDPQFFDQWQYVNDGSNGGKEGADIDMDLAWDLTTGGVTMNGDTIVACVIDGGMDPDHLDFEDNLWVNHDEIPDNAIDDDGNGYVDDYHGWNVSWTNNNDDVFSGGSHGTPVAGIIGAKGNNGVGVAGVNWDVKLMIVKGGGNEAEALEAYNYPYVMRKRYNESDGEEGAFVVVTNASWGTDLLHWEDAPIWCSFYDTLGSVGILNCGATANSNYNIDVDGDMPTSCPSDYLISVTNMDRTDVKVNSAGYGLETIDLGAFGSQTYTTKLGNSYGGFGGTSGATPHVSGAVALAYSMDCEIFAELIKNNPSQSALFVKNLILQGVDANESLTGKTLTGGRLNINNSLLLMDALCSGCGFPLDIASDSIGGESVVISWEENMEEDAYDLIYRLKSEEDWDTLFDVKSPLLIGELETCSDYELKIRTNCSDTSSVFGFSYSFKTDGCCTVPELLDVIWADNDIEIVIEDILAANSYELQYQLYGTENWDVIVQDSSNFILPHPGECQSYLYRFKALCGDEAQYSNIFIIEQGCDDCLQYEYCQNGLNNSYEYIDSFKIGSFLMASGPNEDAYGLYDFATASTLKAGQSYSMELVPAFWGNTYDEYIKIFLDTNRDGIFSPEEMIYEIFSEDGEKVIDEVQIPKVISEGYSRMRVMMIFKTFTDPCSQDLIYGEVEDYCVYLDSEISDCLLKVPSVYLVEEHFDAIDLGLDYLEGTNEYEYYYREKGAQDWLVGISSDTLFTIAGLDSCKTYELYLNAQCIDGQGENTEVYEFKTDCISSTQNLDMTGYADFRIVPHPVDDNIQIYMQGYMGSSLSIEILTLEAKVMCHFNIESTGRKNRIILDHPSISKIKAGIYLLKISDGKQSLVQKMVKM